MEGVIVKYFEEKGFGFIEGEDSSQYFFHKDRINPIFLQNDPKGFPILYSYYLTEDKLDRTDPVYILEFNPIQGKKGLVASDVKPTSAIVNTEEKEFMVQITDLKFENMSVSYFNNHPNYGAIARDYSSIVWMSYKKIGGYGKGKVDVRSKILEVNNRKKITQSLIENISNNIINKKVVVSRYKEPNDNLPIDVSDVVFHGSRIVHSVDQFILNWEKLSNKRDGSKLFFDYDILVI
jgi:hypothetical protein